MITATIYTTPHIAHWLKLQYGSPVELPRGCSFRSTFLSCLGKDVLTPALLERDGLRLSRVEITVNKNIISSYGHTIRKDRLKYLTRILVEDMDRHIYDFVNAHKTNAGSIDVAIALFQEHMHFDEKLYSFDTIRQRYFRYKRKLQNNFHSSVTKIKAA